MAQPQAHWLERTMDLGVFYEKDGKVSCQMRVVNAGNDALVIVKAQAGCGCTGISYRESPIQPGDTAAVDITYNPAGRPGLFSKQVIIFTNTTPKRTVLEITGNVIPTAATLDKQYPILAGALRVSQPSIPFGELTKGENKTLFLSCYNASTDTILVKVDGAKPHLKPALVPDTVPPAKVTALTVHYLSGNAPLWGLNVDTLTITSQTLKKQGLATATIHVMAQVAENFNGLSEKQLREAPVTVVDCGERLDYGSITTREGETVTRSFTVTNKGKQPLAIRRLWVPDGEGITVKADKTMVKRGKTATVTAVVDPSKLQGEVLNVPLTLMTNDPAAPCTTVRLVGIIDKKHQ